MTRSAIHLVTIDSDGGLPDEGICGFRSNGKHQSLSVLVNVLLSNEIEMLDGSEEVGVRKRGEFVELLRMSTQRLVSRRVNTHNYADDDDDGDDCGCDDEIDNYVLTQCIRLSREKDLALMTHSESRLAIN